MRYTVTAEPRGEQYAELLRTARRWCPTALLVVRDQLAVNDAGAAFLRRLAELAPRKRRGASWPGTTLLGSEADIYELPLDDRAIDLFVSAADGLYDWQQPDLPEDLCLLTDTGDPWLVSIAHESDAYVNLRDGELDTLRVELPAFAAALEADEPFPAP